MAKVDFAIESWSAWSADKPQNSDWLDWANDRPINSSISEPDVSMIPAMKRRRMSNLTKIAFATALNCIKNTALATNCVFASQHGELERTVKILNALAASNDVSPTDFSLSVHNTALGLFSIHTGNKQPAVTVAAGSDTFGYALLEASILLSRFPEIPVLLVYFDQPLPEPLSNLTASENQAMSIALLLTSLPKSTTNTAISMSFKYNAEAVVNNLNPGAEFLKFYLTNGNSGQANTSRMKWYWNKL